MKKNPEKKPYDVPTRLQTKRDTDLEWRGGGLAQPLVKLAKKIYEKIKAKKSQTR